MAGGTVSRATVTVKVQTADSRQEFVARQVTVVVPKGNNAPDGGEQVTTAFVGQPAVVVGAGYVTTVVLATPQSQLVRLAGQVMRRGLVPCPKASAVSMASSGTSRARLQSRAGEIRQGQAVRPGFGHAPE
jgi:hypothetical protein